MGCDAQRIEYQTGVMIVPQFWYWPAFNDLLIAHLAPRGATGRIKHFASLPSGLRASPLNLIFETLRLWPAPAAMQKTKACQHTGEPYRRANSLHNWNAKLLLKPLRLHVDWALSNAEG
jgi:hypothetical protein